VGLKQGIAASANALMEFVGSLFSFLGLLALWAVVPIYLAFFLATETRVLPKLREQMTFLPATLREDLLYLLQEFSNILIAYFRGQVVIAVLTGCILGVGFTLIGLEAGLLIGFVAGLANLVPYLGTTLGALTILPYAYLVNDGGWPMLAITAAVFITAQLIQDYVLTPRVMGERTGLGPVTIIFAIFFWGTALGGMAGIILAIPLTAFFIVFWRLAKKRWLPRYQCSQPATAQQPQGL
jgi:predicted PurR-regulated permease PerM